MFVTVKRYPHFAKEIAGINNDLSALFDTDRVVACKFTPPIDIVERENEYALYIELASVAREDVKINVEDSVLTISGERKAHSLNEKSGLLRNEIPSGSFSRTVRLPKNIDATRISAELQDGVLKVMLPKQEAALPRTITIN